MILSSMFLYEHLAFFVFHKPQNILAKKIRNCQTKAVKADMIYHPQTYTWLEKTNTFSLSLDGMTFTTMTFFHMTKNENMMITAMTYTAQILRMIAMMKHQFFLLMYTKQLNISQEMYLNQWTSKERCLHSSSWCGQQL